MSGTGREGENKETASDPYIPTDLCEEILYRLPSNDLRKFKRVCKDWLRLISSKGFVHKHLERSKADCNHPKLVLRFKTDYINHPKSMRHQLFDSSTAILDCANNTSKEIYFDQNHILGCCDGLVLYYDDSSYLGKIEAFNPSTGEAAVIVGNRGITDSKPWIFSWFGHHPSTGEYVLALAYANRFREEVTKRIITLQVYSLSLDHRNNINSSPQLSCSSTLELDRNLTLELDRNFSVCRDERNGTLLHGRLHCSTPVSYDYRNIIESLILVYDFETNKIMTMSPPVESHDIHQILGVVDGCLCAIQEKQAWMMKEYGVEASWTKYANIEGYENGGILKALTFCPNGRDVIITEKYSTTSSWYGFIVAKKYSSKLSRYGFKEKDINIFKAYENWIIDDCIASIDSLVSPTLILREDE